MQPYHIQGACTLDCSRDEDGMIHLRMGGNLSEDAAPLFREWAESVKAAMREAAAEHPTRVLTLIEVLGSIEADKRSIEVLHDLMRHNKDYATRTAVFGASFFTRQIIEMAIHVTGRDNMKQFDSRDEALVWLYGQDR